MTKDEFKMHSWRSNDKVVLFDETSHYVIAVHLGLNSIKIGIDGGSSIWVTCSDILRHTRDGREVTSDEYKTYRDLLVKKNDEIETLFQENADLRKQINKLKNSGTFKVVCKQYADQLDAVQRMLTNIECCFKSKTLELTDLRKFIDNTICED